MLLPMGSYQHSPGEIGWKLWPHPESREGNNHINMITSPLSYAFTYLDEAMQLSWNHVYWISIQNCCKCHICICRKKSTNISFRIIDKPNRYFFCLFFIRAYEFSGSIASTMKATNWTLRILTHFKFLYNESVILFSQTHRSWKF